MSFEPRKHVRWRFERLPPQVKGFPRFLALLALLTLGGCTTVLGDFVSTSTEPEPNTANTVDAGVADVAPFDASLDDALAGEGGPVLLCAPGQIQCMGTALQVCNGDGDGWVTKSNCATVALCNQGLGVCDAPACAVGDHACLGADLQVCNPDQTGFAVEKTCAGPGYCSTTPPACTATPCTAGGVQCNGAELQVCGTAGTWSTVQTCRSAELCDATSQACTAPACPANSYKCLTDGSLQQCNPGRTAYATVKQCTPATSCDATNGQCDVCVPNSKTCVGTILHQCAANGLLDSTSTCVTADLCNQTTGMCTTPACGVRQYHCSGATLQQCNAGRTAFATSAACASGALCIVNSTGTTGSCKAATCVANRYKCTGANLQQCNTDRTAFVTSKKCATSALCSANTSGTTGVCNDPACGENQYHCNGAVLQQCNAGRTAYTNLQTCTTAALCNITLGICDTAACTPNMFKCFGTTLAQCNAGGTGYVPHATCVTSALCHESPGQCAKPTCQPGDTQCAMDGSLQTCNADQTGWDSAPCDPGQTCDATLMPPQCTM